MDPYSLYNFPPRMITAQEARQLRMPESPIREQYSDEIREFASRLSQSMRISPEYIGNIATEYPRYHQEHQTASKIRRIVSEVSGQLTHRLQEQDLSDLSDIAIETKVHIVKNGRKSIINLRLKSTSEVEDWA